MPRLNDDPPNREDWLPLELCTGETPECPHYYCPDGWHAGNAPNCSCTPDCALGHCGDPEPHEPHSDAGAQGCPGAE